MIPKITIPVRVRSFLLIFYMLAAFSWWALQLWQLNDALLDSQVRLEELKQSKPGGLNMTRFRQTEEFKALEKRWERRRRMVLLEGWFFTMLLIYGLMMFDRSSRREIKLARQRRNFMLSITHELKSPLASVRLVLETICRRREELNAEQAGKLCTNGLRDAARLQVLVEDLLLAARLEDGWQPLPEPVDLATTVREAVNGLIVRFPKANIICHIPENFSPVKADKQGLFSVISNLLENAVKYSSEGSLVEFKAEKTPQGVRFSVADQGFGIPDSEKQAVFEKFYRLGNEETRQATGTGLGLYIVRQVVQAHRGKLKLTDNTPQGTVFTIEL